jgi:hypothetical protein
MFVHGASAMHHCEAGRNPERRARRTVMSRRVRDRLDGRSDCGTFFHFLLFFNRSTFMSFLFALAVLVSFMGLAVGLAVPEMALSWLGGRRTRVRVLRIYGLAFLASLGLFSAADSGLPPVETVPPLSAMNFVPPSAAAADAPVAAAAQDAALTFYAHSTLNVRSRPSAESRIVRTLRRGETVIVGEAREGWSPVLVDGRPDGYVSRGTGALHPYAPAADPEPLVGSSGESRSSSRPSASSRRGSGSRTYHTGPRGGCYYYSASGRKQYVDRSYCN